MAVEKVNVSFDPNNFSIFKTGSVFISHFGMIDIVDVASHLTGGDLLLRFVVESAATFVGDDEPTPASSGISPLMSNSSLPNCLRRFSANEVAISFCESRACNSWSETSERELSVRIHKMNLSNKISYPYQTDLLSSTIFACNPNSFQIDFVEMFPHSPIYKAYQHLVVCDQ